HAGADAAVAGDGGGSAFEEVRDATLRRQLVEYVTDGGDDVGAADPGRDGSDEIVRFAELFGRQTECFEMGTMLFERRRLEWVQFGKDSFEQRLRGPRDRVAALRDEPVVDHAFVGRMLVDEVHPI